jgi:hypothetical protein
MQRSKKNIRLAVLLMTLATTVMFYSMIKIWLHFKVPL